MPIQAETLFVADARKELILGLETLTSPYHTLPEGEMGPIRDPRKNKGFLYNGDR
ncbi:MAG: hypothetical protein AAFW87_00355 [Pseudomonadota bacterium]